MLNIEELIKTGTNLKVEIFAKDLMAFAQETATKTIEGLEKHLKKESESQCKSRT